MAKVEKRWINLDRENSWLVATDVMIDNAQDMNIKDYIDDKAANWVTVYEKNVDPTETDDGWEGYKMWDVWINTDSDEAFRIVDTTDDNAVWIKTSLTADELSQDALRTETQETITLAQGDIDNKYVGLSHEPVNWVVELTPVWWPEQNSWDDFEIKEWATAWVNDRLSWDGKWMDWILESWDKLKVTYKYL